MWAGRAKKLRGCLLDLPFDPEDSGNTDLRNVDELITDYMTFQKAALFTVKAARTFRFHIPGIRYYAEHIQQFASCRMRTNKYNSPPPFYLNFALPP